ncbi:MAG: response regulator [Acidobacteriaceae bacterium]|nr:response regulator [Acidobacteriaceae bacterium]
MTEQALLLIDDEDAAAFLFELALRESGLNYQVFRSADGEQGLAFLQRSGPYQNVPRPSLVILDLNLPRKTGLEILAEMQRDARMRDIPVVVLTSSSLMTDKRLALSFGAKSFITKPHTFEAYIDALRQACTFATGDQPAHT